ncbi:MAG: hypothetical protein KA796_07590 [Chryseobacterium sp.]|nr:hypothetical protein [Chryseobacterium sp.]MBP7499711.1 hypothetical protein [Chryseobacterium sp.]
MKLSLLLVLIIPLNIFSQSFAELDSILKITKTEFNTNELRIYRKHSNTTGLELFRFYQDKNELWKADFYQTIAKRDSKNNIDIRIRKEKLNSLKNFELIWLQILNSDILFLPKFDKIEYKLKQKNNYFEIMDGEIYNTISKVSVLDGKVFFIKIKNGNRFNEIIYPNPQSYLTHYSNVDELQSVAELLEIVKSEFKIFDK